jgi:hypothetical protein
VGKTQFPNATAGGTYLYIITVVSGVNSSNFRKIAAFLNKKKFLFIFVKVWEQKNSYI